MSVRRPRPGSRGAVLPSGLPADVYSAPCPSRAALDRLADKWTVLLIGALTGGSQRFSQLRTTVDGVSEKMLTQTLRSLERDGLVTRTVFATVPPRVDYELTPLGRSLNRPMAAVRAWAEEHINEVQEARSAYDDAR